MELVNQHYGDRDFAVRDPEGHTWSLGTYEPRQPAGIVGG